MKRNLLRIATTLKKTVLCVRQALILCYWRQRCLVNVGTAISKGKTYDGYLESIRAAGTRQKYECVLLLRVVVLCECALKQGENVMQ